MHRKWWYLLLELNSSWFCTNGGRRCVLRLWSLHTQKETTTVHTASAFASVHKNIDLSLQLQTGTNNIQHLTFNVSSCLHWVSGYRWAQTWTQLSILLCKLSDVVICQGNFGILQRLGVGKVINATKLKNSASNLDDFVVWWLLKTHAGARFVPFTLNCCWQVL